MRACINAVVRLVSLFRLFYCAVIAAQGVKAGFYYNLGYFAAALFFADRARSDRIYVSVEIAVKSSVE